MNQAFRTLIPTMNYLYLSRTNTSHDVWQFGIVIFVCLTGCLPWQKAAPDDPRYSRYVSWQNSSISLKRQPKLFKLVTSKAQKLFKKYLEPKPDKRPTNLSDVHRFLEDRWMSKSGIEKNAEIPDENEGLCPSMYSFHSSPEEKNKLLFTLTQYGLETTVDRSAKKDRIRQWIQSSVIEEENEDTEDIIVDEEIDNQAGPVGERMQSRGPVTDPKKNNGHVTFDESPKEATFRSSLRKIPEYYIPPIDPRIPLEQQKRTRVVNGILKNRQQQDNVVVADIRNDAPPFQNVPNNSEGSSSLASSSDSSGTIKHRINVQIPQMERYSYNASDSNRQNGNVLRTPPVNKRQVFAEGGTHKIRNANGYH